MGINYEQLKELGCRFHHGAILSDVYYWNDIKIHACPGGEVSEPDAEGYDDVHPIYVFEPPDDDHHSERVTICYLHTVDEFKQWADTFDLEKWKAEHQPATFKVRDRSNENNNSLPYGAISRPMSTGSYMQPVHAPFWNANVLEPKKEEN